MLRRYETIAITSADRPDDDILAMIDRYRAVIEGRKGLVGKIEKWGKRKLAYEIKKVSKGFYLLFDYAGQAEVVDELERNFKIDDQILKFMTVKTHDKVDLEALEKEIAASREAAPEASPETAPVAEETQPAEQAPDQTPVA